MKTLAFHQGAKFDQDLSVEVSFSKIGSYALTRIASEWLEKLKKAEINHLNYSLDLN